MQNLFNDIRDYLIKNELLKNHLSKIKQTPTQSVCSNNLDKIDELNTKIVDYYSSAKNTWPSVWFEITRVNDISIPVNIEARDLFIMELFLQKIIGTNSNE